MHWPESSKIYRWISSCELRKLIYVAREIFRFIPTLVIDQGSIWPRRSRMLFCLEPTSTAISIRSWWLSTPTTLTSTISSQNTLVSTLRMIRNVWSASWRSSEWHLPQIGQILLFMVCPLITRAQSSTSRDLTAIITDKGENLNRDM